MKNLLIISTLVLLIVSSCNSKHKKAVEFYKSGLVKLDSSKDYKGAISDFNQALELDPKFSVVYYKRGYTYAMVQLFDEALADFNTAIEMNPSDTLAYNDRALTKSQFGSIEEAMDDFDKAISLDKKYAEAYSNRGLNKLYLGRYYDGLSDFNYAIEYNPNKVLGYYFNRGLCYILLHRYDNAIEDFNECLKINPEFDQAHEKITEAKAKKENSMEAKYDDSEVSLLKYRSHLVFQKAKKNLKDEKYEDGIKSINKFITDVDTLINRLSKMPYQKQGEFNQKKIADLKNDLCNVYFLRGEIKQAMHLDSQACEDWTIAIEYGNTDAVEQKEKYCK